MSGAGGRGRHAGRAVDMSGHRCLLLRRLAPGWVSEDEDEDADAGLVYAPLSA